MKVVAALGGNALARRGEPIDAEGQRKRVRDAATALSGIAHHHELIVTHGNGPQIGWLSRQAGDALPLDVLGAESEGVIGYWIEQELGNQLPGRDVATLLTQVEVSPDDPAFAHPTKPVGPVLEEDAARRLAEAYGWEIAREGVGWRRVVPSPDPRDVHELRTIDILVKLGVVVVCSGGGGIPVVRDSHGGLRGVEAVIDKDLSAALLGSRLAADVLLLLTDVPGIFEDWPEPARRLIRSLPPRHLDELELDAGSMAPKARAAHRFATQPGRFAVIGALEDAERMLAREAGTVVAAEVSRMEIEER